jgi:predicted nucleic acid-binding protein
VRLTLDTNVLVYAFDPGNPARQEAALGIVLRATRSDCVLTLQALGEFYNTLRRKRIAPSDAEQYVKALRRQFRVVAASEQNLDDAMAAVREHNLTFWDALLWATAAAAGCRILVSENFQTDCRLGPIVFRNPFGRTFPPDLDAALAK